LCSTRLRCDQRSYISQGGFIPGGVLLFHTEPEYKLDREKGRFRHPLIIRIWTTLPLSQMLCIFSALHHNSVNVVIVWTTAGGVAIEAAVGYLLTGVTLEREPRLALTVGFGAGILELVFDTDKVAVGVLMLLLWSLSKAAECVWRRLREDATLGGRIAGGSEGPHSSPHAGPS